MNGIADLRPSLAVSAPVLAVGAVGGAGGGTEWTEVTSAWAAAAAALLAALTLVVAMWAAVYAKRQVEGARAQLEEARSLRREQAQAYVVIYARTHDEVSAHQVDLVLENLGATGARNVVVTSKPPLVRTDPATGG